MPLTYCRMRVNVNEKYIIHIPLEWSRRASQDASSLHREGKEDKARLHHLLSVLLIFLVFISCGEGVATDVRNYILLGINFCRFPK